MFVCCRKLNLAEAGAALEELNVSTAKEDILALFKYLAEGDSSYLV